MLITMTIFWRRHERIFRHRQQGNDGPRRVLSIRRTGTDVGVALQNIIPLPKVTANAVFTSVQYEIHRAIPTKLPQRLPITLSTPILFNAGVNQHFNTIPGLSLSFDWVDIAAQIRHTYRMGIVSDWELSIE